MNPVPGLGRAVFLGLCAMVCAAGEAWSGEDRLGPGTHTLALRSGGHERSYLVHVPKRYDSAAPLPLVVMLHGGGGTARGAMRETGWAEKADRDTFLVAFPNALARDPARRASFSGNPQLWNDGSERFYAGQAAVDDVAFIGAMLDALAVRFAVDPRRVFATGFSNGASMSFRLGAELPQRIAAIAPVAGALWIEPPALRPPVPMLYITGTADPLNLIEGGIPRLASGGSDPVRAKPKPPVAESIAKWARALGCPVSPVSDSSANGVRTRVYCEGGAAEVRYVAVEDLGHTWAGGKSLLPERMVGKTSDKLLATDTIWAFFRKHGTGSAR